MGKLFGLSQRTPIGVDVGGRSVKAVQLSRGPRGWRVEATASFGRAQINGPFAAAEAQRLADVLRRRSFAGNQIVLAVPDEKLIVGSMELPSRGGGASLDAVARVEFARAYKCDANGFEMAYWDLPAPARATRATNVMAVACTHASADALVDLCAVADLDVVGLDARPCAMARACAPAAQDVAGIVILLELGWNGAVLVVLHRNVVVYERTIAESALKNLVAEVGTALRVAPELTERLLAEPDLFRGDSQPAPAPAAPERGAGTSMAAAIPADVLSELRAIIALHFEAVARDVMASVSYSSHQYPDAAVARLLVLGGGALLAGVAEHLQALLGFECRVVTPLASAAVAAPALARECNAALTTATGLAQFDQFQS